MDSALQTLIQAAIEHHRARRFPQAEALYRQVLQQSPENPDALFLLGVLASEAQRDDLAIRFMQRSIRASPTVQACESLGRLLTAVQRPKEAIGAFNKAIDLNAEEFEQPENRAIAADRLRKLEAGLDAFERAASSHLEEDESLKFDFALALNNCGNLARYADMREKAATIYRKALAVRPDLAAIWHNLGLTYGDMGDVVEALSCYDRALALAPDVVQTRWARALAPALPTLNDPEHTTPQRQAIMREFDALDDWFDDERTATGYQIVGENYPFYLAYQESDNRDLLARHGALCCRLMQHWQSRRGYQPRPLAPTGRLQLGIVSPNIRNHSVWHAIIKGWLRYLEPEQVEIHLFSTSNIEDSETDWAKQHVASYTKLGQDLDQAVASILSRQLDVLIYPAIGMDLLCIRLASLRLCRLQMMSWGHPETSGLPTIDYYLSAEDLEPERADENYSETLIALPKLGCSYQPFADNSADPDFSGLGLSEDSPLLISPGVPFKYAPQHDRIYVEIARRLEDCQIVFFTGPAPELSKKFQTRLQNAFEREGLDFSRNCRFVRWLDQPQFYGLLKRADVFLDTIGFSGFNTAIQAIECGLPIVTREGRFLRGRLASGILRRLELTELIAADAPAYVDLAVRLVRDRSYQRDIRRKIWVRRSRLFNDPEPVRALQQILFDLARPNEAKAF